jgi:hypothetical protein
MNRPKVICIDDKNKPHEIKQHLWIKKDNEYTITHIYYHPQQQIQGVELAEVELDDSCFPYVSFSLARFAIPQDQLELFIALLKDCTDLNDIDIKKLIEEEYLETA